jgi:beta-lactamase class A
MTVVLIVLSHAHLSSVNQSQASPPIVSLLDRLNDVDLSAAQGQVGIGVMDLNTGKSWFHNGDRRLPMQSVYKLPVGIVVLKQVDAGKLSLDRLVTVSRQDFAPLWSPIREEIKGNSKQFTVRELLERSVGVSDIAVEL